MESGSPLGIKGTDLENGERLGSGRCVLFREEAIGRKPDSPPPAPPTTNYYSFRGFLCSSFWEGPHPGDRGCQAQHTKSIVTSAEGSKPLFCQHQ